MQLRRKRGILHNLLRIIIFRKFYTYKEETTRNPIQWLYWRSQWDKISCVHCRKKLARDISMKKVRSCIACSIDVKEEMTGITQRMPHPLLWGCKLKGIWY